MLEPEEQFRKTLKAHNQSLTLSRQLVFDKLQNKEPQSMRDIVVACRGEADRASVYRTITMFERIGIIKRLQIGWKYKLELTDIFHHHHHHLTCLRCGRIIPLAEDDKLENRLKILAKTQNFKMNDHQLEIQGLCDQCH